MPVVAFELPKPTPAGSSAGSTARRLQPKSATQIMPGASPTPAISFRQQLSSASQPREAPASTPESTGPSRASRSEASTPSAKPSTKSRRKQAGADPQAQETPSADAAVNRDGPESAASKNADPATTDAEAAEADEAIEAADNTDRPDDDAPVATADDPAAVSTITLQAAVATTVGVNQPPQLIDGTAPVDTDAVANQPASIEAIDAKPALPPATAAGVASAGQIAVPGDVTAEGTTSLPAEKPSTGVSPSSGQPASHHLNQADALPADASESDISATGTTAAVNTAAGTGEPAGLPTTLFEQFAEAFSLEDDAAGSPIASASGEASSAAATAGPGNAQPTKLADRDLPAIDAEPASSTEARFAAANIDRIATDVRGALLPNGGKMELRLDPPELGALQVSLHLKDGVVTASFQTQNPDAARMLSHSLGDLRASLEAHGVVVDKLHVQQAPRDEGSNNNANSNHRHNQSAEQQQDSRREQQRKDMVQRLWDQLAGNAPIDVRA